MQVALEHVTQVPRLDNINELLTVRVYLHCANLQSIAILHTADVTIAGNEERNYIYVNLEK